MRKPAILAAALAAAVLVTAGCATEPVASRKDISFDAAAANPLIPSNYAAADSLLAQLRGQLAPTQALIAATVVNIDALEQSSTLGRLISEQVLIQQGGETIEFHQRVLQGRSRKQQFATPTEGALERLTYAVACSVGVAQLVGFVDNNQIPRQSNQLVRQLGGKGIGKNDDALSAELFQRTTGREASFTDGCGVNNCAG